MEIGARAVTCRSWSYTILCTSCLFSRTQLKLHTAICCLCLYFRTYLKWHTTICCICLYFIHNWSDTQPSLVSAYISYTTEVTCTFFCTYLYLETQSEYYAAVSFVAL